MRLVDLVPGTANGITLCQGSFSEWPGMDIAGAIREFGARTRSTTCTTATRGAPSPAYVETWIDEGDTDMLRAMRAYREVGYRFTLCSDHVPQMTDDLDFGLIGRAYNHGYIRAMIPNCPS